MPIDDGPGASERFFSRSDGPVVWAAVLANSFS